MSVGVSPSERTYQLLQPGTGEALSAVMPPETTNEEIADPSRLKRVRDIARQFAGRTALALSLTTGLVVVEATVPVAAHADTGGYPWSDAAYVDANYDWGYSTCPSSDSGCMLFSDYKAGTKYGEADPWGYYLRNCTSFVAWKLTSLGVSAAAVRGLGNGGDWYNNAPASEQSTAPKAGDAAVKPGTTASPYGHVAYVDSVNADGTITIEEYNHAGTGTWDSRTGTPTNLGFSKYVDFGLNLSGSTPAQTFNPRPAAISYNGELDVFVKGGDDEIYKDTWSGSSWSGFSDLGGGHNMASDPVVVQYNGELDVISTGKDGHVYKDTYGNGQWSGFSDMGGGFSGTPAAVAYGSELDIFAKGSGGAIYKNTWTGDHWTGFSSLGGAMAANPAAISYNGEMDVFARDGYGTVYKNTWNGSSWSGFNFLG